MGATFQDRPTGPLNEADIAGAGDTRYARINFFKGELFGLIMSTAGSSTTLTVGAGSAVDSTGARAMNLASAMAKTTSAWAAGTAAGGLDTGSIAASTWYHWFLIMNVSTGVVDVVFSATATPANGPTTMPSGYTLFRRIGSMLTNGSSQWTLFHQLGDEFLWDVSVVDFAFAANGVTTAVLKTLTVPTGIQVNALGRWYIGNTTATFDQFLVTSPDESDQIASSNLFSSVIPTGATGTFNTILVNHRTNTSAQLRTRTSTTTLKYSINTHGWIDTRGKLQ